ncbi:MAG: hypothetical protein ACREOQ_00770 [Gemmatimonadales bacterium]
MTGGEIKLEPGPSLGDIKNAPTETPVEAPPVKPSPFRLDRAGVDLAKFVLWMMAGFVLLMLAYMVYAEHQSDVILTTTFTRFQSSPADSSAFKLAVQQIDAFQKSSRDFLHEILNMVLLNVLLPVLTALLGYVFGKQSGELSSAKEEAKVP